jgi:hypothetical protein
MLECYFTANIPQAAARFREGEFLSELYHNLSKNEVVNMTARSS